MALSWTRKKDLDITDLTAVRQALLEEKPEVVINCAAYTLVDQAEKEKDLAFHVNAKGPEVLATACHEFQIQCVHISTDFVFDGTKSSPYLETDAPHPLGVYAASKLAGEQAILSKILLF